jgi:hypothetical protein
MMSSWTRADLHTPSESHRAGSPGRTWKGSDLFAEVDEQPSRVRDLHQDPGQELLRRLFRERLLARLVDKHAISQELVAKLMAWRHPGFSAFVGEAIPPENTKAIEDMAGYVVRNPVSLKRLVYVDGQQAVIYRALKPNPRLGQNFVAMDPLEWLARLTDHVPDPGKHRTLAYGH